MPNHRLARTFLRRVWGAQLTHLPDEHRNDGLTAFLAQKGADASWTDMPLTVSDRVRLHLPDDSSNLYYAVNLFEEQRRIKRFVPGGCWLYADLDEVDPRSLDDVPPTLAIESSPGRYQALWLLDRWVGPRSLGVLNQKMTYFTRADRGNWKLTQVLRVPGTVSTKHGFDWEVKLLWSRTSSRVYVPRELMSIVGDVETPADIAHSRELSLPKAPPRRILSRYSRTLSARAKKLVHTKTVLGDEDRSSRLWELECLLLEAGMKPEEVFVVVRATPWNKWSGSPRETEQLWTEVQKAAANVERRQGTPRPRNRSRSRNGTTPARNGNAPDTDEEVEFPPVGISDNGDAPAFTPVPIARYLGKTKADPAWLVEGIWAEKAHGLWAGDYKTYKSTMLADLAISVASGLPFLGHFPVRLTGPTLVIQEENGPGFMHDKLHRIMQAKGIGTELLHLGGNRLAATLGTAIPCEFLNMKRFDLTNDDHLRWLDAYVAQGGHKLVILDPLYRLAPTVDESSAVELAPLLAWIATLADERDAAVILAHHYNKPKQDSSIRIGHRVSGTGVLNRWWASSVYVERMGQEEDHSVRFTAQHREHPATAQMVAHFEMPEAQPDHYTVELTDGNDEQHDTVDGDAIHKSYERRPGKTDKSKKDRAPAGTRTISWLYANDETVLKYIAQVDGAFRVDHMARKLKLARSRDLMRFLEKNGYTMQKITLHTSSNDPMERFIAQKREG